MKVITITLSFRVLFKINLNRLPINRENIFERTFKKLNKFLIKKNRY